MLHIVHGKVQSILTILVLRLHEINSIMSKNLVHTEHWVVLFKAHEHKTQGKTEKLFQIKELS